jgi:two-component system CheB/CheR fusion protein
MAMASDPGSPAVRVLYAEDNAFDADLTRVHFETHAPEYQLEIVRTGKECIDRAMSSNYDVVLLDNRLPDIDGLDVLRELAAKRAQLPVVVATAVGDEALAVQVLRLGARDYVVKDGNYIEKLPAILRNAIDDQRKRRAQLESDGPSYLRILYVEHDPADIDLTLKHFAEVAPHFRVDVVSSAEEALTRIHEGTVDLVLTDLRMPDMSALDLLKEARHDGIQVPFIIITGRGDETAAVAALKLGAYDYIVKRGGYITHLPYVIENAITRSKLAKTNRLLHAELSERERAEAEARGHADALADAARQKDEFLAMLGHELRNPLAPIRTALELLRRERPEDQISKSAYEVMDRQVAHMARLLDDLLDVARITSGRINLNMQPIDLRRVVGDAIESVRSLIQARHHRLETTMPPRVVRVVGDETRLVQVIVNLLNNAAKYTNDGGTIRVTVTDNGRNAEVHVVDTGTGISPRLLPKIFDLFTQDERTLDRAQGGLGLGLTLVRKITELHGGTVEARSGGREQGSEFIVTLPLETPAAAVDSETPELRTTSRSLRCLVVEDNVDAAHMLEIALSLEGHSVRLAFDGVEAVEAAATFKPEAIVLDIGLPRMNGFDAARAIRRLPGLGNVLIIALTGYGQAVDYQKSREAGIDSLLVKPIELDDLLHALAAVGQPHHG